MAPADLFAAGNAVALAGWLALAISLLVPQSRTILWRMTGLGVPAVLAVAYAFLLWRGLAEVQGGGFDSIAAVRTLFANDAALTAGWLHYLAFDLFVGTWIARAGVDARLPVLTLLPCLGLTFLAGPAGLLLFLLLRALVRRERAVLLVP
jgi:hypothetical protein